MIQERKKKIREGLIKKLRAYKEEERLKKSSAIGKKLFALKDYIEAKTVMFYLSFDGEVDTQRMITDSIKQGKRVAVPAIQKEHKKIIPSLVEELDSELKTGPHGVRHPKDEHLRPVSLEHLDLVIVPGLAFDKAGNRLGRGMGYYDRFLSLLPKHVPTIGLAFDFQIIPDFPPLEPHDFSVSQVLFA